MGASKIILIVDDNPMNLKVVRVLLTTCGYDVRTAIDAEEALHLLETVHPDNDSDGYSTPRHGWAATYQASKGQSSDAGYSDRGDHSLRHEGR